MFRKKGGINSIKKKSDERGGKTSEETSNLLDELTGAERDSSDLNSMALAVVTRGLNHLVVSSIDSNVVDGAGAVTKEDKITGLTLGKRILGALVVLILSVVRKGLSCSLVDRVEGKTAAIKANNITIITIGL